MVKNAFEKRINIMIPFHCKHTPKGGRNITLEHFKKLFASITSENINFYSKSKLNEVKKNLG